MEDSRIVAQYWSRSENAIRETQLAYGSYCMTIARNILGNDEDAEECVSDAYLKAWNAIPPERPVRLGLYLGRIVRNLSLNRKKAANTVKRGGGQYVAALEELSDTLTDGKSAESAWESKQIAVHLERFLLSLPKEKRVVFMMRYWYFDTVETIAKKVNASQNSVKVTLFRIRKDLKKYLEKEGISL